MSKSVQVFQEAKGNFCVVVDGKYHPFTWLNSYESAVRLTLAGDAIPMSRAHANQLKGRMIEYKES